METNIYSSVTNPQPCLHLNLPTGNREGITVF